MASLFKLKPVCTIFREFSVTSVRTIMASPTKLMKKSQSIGVHDGTFHCDDVTACFMLKQLDRFRDHEIVRTRDSAKLAEAEIVVDVGGELDIENLRLDHHQRSFNQTIKDYFPNLKTTNPNKPPRLSSSGLVYALFGKDVITKTLGLGQTYETLESDHQKVIDKLFEKAYIEFFEEIDAIDNGVEVVSGENLVHNYHINSDLSRRVGRLNPPGLGVGDDERLKSFKEAMELVGKELISGIRFLYDYWWPCRESFRKYIEERHEVDPSGQIVHLKDELVGWGSALLDLEEELNIQGQLKYVVYCDNSATSPWRAVAVPTKLKSFETRAPLKEAWRGKRDEDLQKVSGVPDAIFVHMTGFTGGARSQAGILSMVRKSLNLE